MSYKDDLEVKSFSTTEKVFIGFGTNVAVTAVSISVFVLLRTKSVSANQFIAKKGLFIKDVDVSRTTIR